MKTISFVIPCYKSEKSIAQVVHNILAQFEKRDDYVPQILLCSDGSPDDVYTVICALCTEDSRVFGMELTRNFGQQGARMALLPYVKGDYVVFSDDDGQHPVSEVFAMIEKLEEGNDAVYANFHNKKHGLIHRMGSVVNKKMMELFIGKPKDIVTSSFFVVRRFIIDELKTYQTPEPYINGFVMQITRRIANVDMPHLARIAGKSGYTFSKLLKLWLTGFTSFSAVPLRFASLAGLISSLGGFIFGIAIIIRKLINPAMQAGYASIMAVMLLLCGLILFVLGLLGEYVGRMFMSINHIPQYVVRDTCKIEKTEE